MIDGPWVNPRHGRGPRDQVTSLGKRGTKLAGHLWINLYLVLGNYLLAAPVGALWVHNLVLSTGTVSAVVWLGWVVGICEVRLSRSLELRYPVVLICNPISVLFRSIGPLLSLGLPHIFLGVLI